MPEKVTSRSTSSSRLSLRVPAKTIFACTCVCTARLSLVFEPYFAKLHIREYIAPKLLRLERTKLFFSLFDVGDVHLHPQSTTSNHELNFKVADFSYNGLALFSDGSNLGIFMLAVLFWAITFIFLQISKNWRIHVSVAGIGYSGPSTDKI